MHHLQKKMTSMTSCVGVCLPSLQFQLQFFSSSKTHSTFLYRSFKSRSSLPSFHSLPPPFHSSPFNAFSSNHSSDSPLPGRNFQFRDDGADVELRLRLPDGTSNASSSNVFVDAKDTSLSVVLAQPSGFTNLFPATRLYGRIKAADTIWFVDEEEIVLSLKKADKEIVWPDLFEEWEALKIGVAKLLKGVSVYIVGASTDINWAVAKELAEGLEYVPLQTSQLLEQAAKMSLENMLVDGEIDVVADAEAMILSNLNTHARLVVGTLGGTHGAASWQEKWKRLRAGISIWLSQSKATDEVSAEEEAQKAKEEGATAYSNAEMVVALSGWENCARPAAEGCLKALKYLLESEKGLPDKKSLYVRLGCRGDWPNIMPPGWDPSGGENKSGKVMAL